MKELLTLENFKGCRNQPSRDALSTDFGFGNKLKEGTENFDGLLKRYK